MRFVIITNIPAPYRLPIYEKIYKEYGDNFLVIYAAKSEANRSWNLEGFKFNYIFLKENVKSKKDGYNYVHNNIDVIKHVRKFNPDVVITTGFNPTHLYAWLYTLLHKKKHIAMTDGWIESENHLSIIHRIVRKIVFKTSSAYIGASKNSLSLYKSYGVSEYDLFRSHLCINNKLFNNNITFEDREYDLMFSGQFLDIKLPFFFVEVAKKISVNIPNIKVLILGDGPLKKDFFKKLDKSHIDYHYAGFVQQKELPKYYSSSKLFLFTTKIDAWGIVANEAMASGTPVITTPYTGIVNDLLIDDMNGLIIDIDSTEWSDKIIEILEDKKKWEKLSQRAIKQVLNFNFDDAANGIINAAKYAYSNGK